MLLFLPFSVLSSETHEYLFIIVCLNAGIKHCLID